MPVRLLTEAQARAEWSGDLLLVRQQRVAFVDLGIMLLRTVVVAMVTLPFWRPVFPEFNILPYWLALCIAAFALVFSHLKAKEVQAARRPEAWLLVANRKMIWLRFRSFWHWQWPADEPTVLAIALEDIDHLVPLRFADGTMPQLAIRLKEEMEYALADVVLDENSKLHGGKFMRGRVHHAPVVLEEGLTGLRVRWSGEFPTLRESCEKLRLNFPIEPPMRLEDSAAGVLANRPRITEDSLAEVDELLRAGDKIGAIKRLRDITGMGLKEAKEMVEQSGWQSGEGDTPPPVQAAGDAGPR